MLWENQQIYLNSYLIDSELFFISGDRPTCERCPPRLTKYWPGSGKCQGPSFSYAVIGNQAPFIEFSFFSLSYHVISTFRYHRPCHYLGPEFRHKLIFCQAGFFNTNCGAKKKIILYEMYEKFDVFSVPVKLFFSIGFLPCIVHTVIKSIIFWFYPKEQFWIRMVLNLRTV